MDPSEFVSAKIREALSKLEEIEARLTGCHVTVEASHRRRHKSQIFHVRIDLTMPGAEVAVSREPEQDHSHEDLSIAIRDAFDSARRRLIDHAGHRSHHQESRPIDAIRAI